MNVLLTGATGFIGTALARALVARGDRVRALVRPTSITGVLAGLGVSLAPGDVLHPRGLAAAVEGCDAVVHLAGLVKASTPAQLFRCNAGGTRLVAEACAEAARPPVLVYVSSLSVAGPSLDGRPRVEEDPPAPVSLYGESKLAGEAAVRAVAGRVPASIVRAPVIYGPGDRELVPQLLRMVKLGVAPRLGQGEKRYSLLHVADLVDGLLAVVERGHRLGPANQAGPEGVYYLEDGTEHRWDDIAAAAFRAAGRRPRDLVLPEALGPWLAGASQLAGRLTGRPSILNLDKLQELRQPAWTCSAARARRELGWTPRLDLETGMADAVRWALAKG